MGNHILTAKERNKIKKYLMRISLLKSTILSILYFPEYFN